MSNSSHCKACLVVLRLVKSDHFRDLKVIKNVHVRGWRVTVLVIRLLVFVDRTHEGHELSWYDPVKVSILNLFIMLIFFNIEAIKTVPFLLHSEFESLQAMQDCALVEAFSLGSFSEGNKVAGILLESIKSFISSHFQDDNHECTHKEA